jgi:hypothetical protein
LFPKTLVFNANVSFTQYKIPNILDRVNAVADDLVAKSSQLHVYGLFWGPSWGIFRTHKLYEENN